MPIAGESANLQHMSRLRNATKTELPSKVPVAQIPESTTTPPVGDPWLHEVKMDGYLQSRTGIQTT